MKARLVCRTLLISQCQNQYYYHVMMEMLHESPFYSQGLRFSCTRCSACCRYESGYVFLSMKDVSRLRVNMKMGYEEFTTAFCRWIPSVNGAEQLSLKEKPNFDCIFWVSDESGGGTCSVYEHRPLQCRAFPFWLSILSSRKTWKMAAQDCPGIDRGELHSHDSIEKWLAQRKKEPIIERVSKFTGKSATFGLLNI